MALGRSEHQPRTGKGARIWAGARAEAAPEDSRAGFNVGWAETTGLEMDEMMGMAAGGLWK